MGGLFSLTRVIVYVFFFFEYYLWFLDLWFPVAICFVMAVKNSADDEFLLLLGVGFLPRRHRDLAYSFHWLMDL